MELIGVIVPQPDSPAFDRERWIELIRSHPNLAADGLREGVNPFTKQPMTIMPRRGAVRVVVDGRDVGEMTLKSGRGGAILVSGEPASMISIAREIAEALRGRFEEGTSSLGPAYWRFVEPVWGSIRIDDGPEVFLAQFGAIPTGVGHLFAAHWCQSEVCNGGFHQFFSNSTGVLAPEARDGFRALGLTEWAEVLDEAMRVVGEPYSRDQATRQARLAEFPFGNRGEGNPFKPMDDRFFAWLKGHPRRFEAVADAFAMTLES